MLALESDYRGLIDQRGPAEAALRRAFTANPRQDWIAIRLAKIMESGGKPEEARDVLLRCLQDNPTSKRVHYELAQFYMRHPKDREKEKELIYDHLRRSFTTGDQNYDAQFWFARAAFLAGQTAEATRTFKALGEASIPPLMRRQVRGLIVDDKGRTQVYVGEVMALEDTYMFVRCADFSDHIFIHRSRAAEGDWEHFHRGDKVMFTVGFGMRGPTGASVRRLD